MSGDNEQNSTPEPFARDQLEIELLVSFRKMPLPGRKRLVQLLIQAEKMKEDTA